MMNKYIKFYTKVFSILIFLISSGYAQNYLWPTNASNHLTSSFCEYRPGHYHSAIDIKTWNQEGYPIYAIADGKIQRIRVSPFGYGKVIYLKLNDGRVAVYAHLQKFNKALEKSVRDQQIRNQRYTINWWPKNKHVKRGDVLGYTGQTGIGVPHLHFEIRDAKEHPLNPLHFYSRVKDSIKPTLQSLMVIPQTSSSRVNGSLAPQVFDLRRNNAGQYIVKQPILAEGVIGLAIRSFDKADGVHNRFAFYRSEMLVNNVPHFQLKYDTLDFATTSQIEIDIFYPEKTKTRRRFNKLYIEPYNQLNFYNRKLGPGLIKVSTDSIPFDIRISDFMGNLSTVKGVILRENPVNPYVLMQTKNEHDLFLHIELPDNLRELKFESASDSSGWQAVDYFEFLGRNQRDGLEALLLKLRLATTADNRLKVKYRTGPNEIQTSFIALEEQAGTNFQLSVENLEKWITLNLDHFYSSANRKLILQTGQFTTELKPYNIDGKAKIAVPDSLWTDDSLNVRIKDNHYVLLDTTLFYHRFLPGQKSLLNVTDHANINLSATGVYDTMLVSAHQRPAEREAFEAPVYSPLIHFDANGHIMKDGIFLNILTDSLNKNPNQMAIYSVSDDYKLNYMGGKLDTVSGQIETRTKRFSSFIVAADTVAPEVKVLFPHTEQKLNRLDRIQFSAIDELSGIGTDKNLSISIDGQFVIPEWDPETDIITGYPHWNVGSGVHQISIEVSDVSGNLSEASFSVIVDGANK